MPKVTFLPHEALCPEGLTVDASAGYTVLDIALENNIHIEHACEKSCACTTCHIIVRQGFQALEQADETEEDMLDKAWGLEPDSRLSCQTFIEQDDLEVEIPKYTLNQVSERA